jgi:hypothetical protein
MKKTEEEPGYELTITIIVYTCTALGFIAGLLIGGTQ